MDIKQYELINIHGSQYYGTNTIDLKFNGNVWMTIYDERGTLLWSQYSDYISIQYNDIPKTLVWFKDKCHYGTVGL